MTRRQRQRKGTDSEYSWLCYTKAKGQGLTPSPWEGRSCPSHVAQGSSWGPAMQGCAMPIARLWYCCGLTPAGN